MADFIPPAHNAASPFADMRGHHVAVRTPDVDNPRGYYEWEAVKRLWKEPEMLNEPGLEGRAIKVVSMLLGQLPMNHEYKIIFMNRPVEEVVASQAAMIERLKTEGAEMDENDLQRGKEVLGEE